MSYIRNIIKFLEPIEKIYQQRKNGILQKESDYIGPVTTIKFTHDQSYKDWSQVKECSFCEREFSIKYLNKYIRIWKIFCNRTYLSSDVYHVDMPTSETMEIVCFECTELIESLVENIREQIINIHQFNKLILKLNNYLIPDLTNIVIEYNNILYYYKNKFEK
jgi:hypothetical protein